jgi:hypothetical protein
VKSCPSTKWLETSAMAGHLGIHSKTLLKLRRLHGNPFREGTHYRRGGLTLRAPLQWHPLLTEEAFTSFRRMPATAVETFSREA